jgi:hypothetical protein
MSFIAIALFASALAGVTHGNCDWPAGEGYQWACQPCGGIAYVGCGSSDCTTDGIPGEATGAACILPALAVGWTCCNKCSAKKNSGAQICEFTQGEPPPVSDDDAKTGAMLGSMLVIAVIIASVVGCVCICRSRRARQRRRRQAEEGGGGGGKPLLGYGTDGQTRVNGGAGGYMPASPLPPPSQLARQ